MEQKDRRFAVLIDADNVSPKYIKYILDEVSDQGVATYKRIYGDWTDISKRRLERTAPSVFDQSHSAVQQHKRKKLHRFRDDH